jgi:putative colanic acid biosynthesis acetyltransferase WcaF
MNTVTLRTFHNEWYRPGRSLLVRALWMFLGLPLFRSRWIPSSQARAALLRLFGATIGKRIVIRQHVIVKYPWYLTVDDDCWIGEQAWIDNLTTVRIARNVCVSQGAYLCTGNHDWSDPQFGLRLGRIDLGEGSWVGAKSVLLPGSSLGRGAISMAGSVISGHVPDSHIVSGNPARFIELRSVGPAAESSAALQTLREVAG